MDEPLSDLPPPHRWHQTGAMVAVLSVLLLAAVLVFIRVQGGNATGTEGNFSINPRALEGIPETSVTVQSADDPRLGSLEAKVVVVEFGDFQCPFCREAFPVIRSIMNRYNDRVLFLYRDYPITDTHPAAQQAAEAGQCAWEQGSNQFWALHDRMFQNQSDLSLAALQQLASASGLDMDRFAECLSSGKYTIEVQADYDDGLTAGVRGTPTFFINQRRFEGPLTLEQFQQILDAELAAKQ